LDDDDSDSDGSVSDIEPDSEDEALLQEKGTGDSDTSMAGSEGRETPTGNAAESNTIREENKPTLEKEASAIIDAPGLKSVLVKQESTRHLAYGLLDLDVGYSSDEGGDDDVAYYVSNGDGDY